MSTFCSQWFEFKQEGSFSKDTPVLSYVRFASLYHQIRSSATPHSSPPLWQYTYRCLAWMDTNQSRPFMWPFVYGNQYITCFGCYVNIIIFWSNDLSCAHTPHHTTSGSWHSHGSNVATAHSANLITISTDASSTLSKSGIDSLLTPASASY